MTPWRELEGMEVIRTSEYILQKKTRGILSTM
jgi:hypothetical protein